MNLKRHQLYLLVLAGAALLLGWISTADGQEGKMDPMQIARGAKAWAHNCGRCHNLREAGDLTDEQWEVSVTHMQVRANLPGEMARDIAAFLKASN